MILSMLKAIAIVGIFVSFLNSSLSQELPIRFEAETIDDEVQIGYGITTGDVDGDGKPDLILADKKEFVWYRNPDWQRFVLAKDLTRFDNVCIAARDIDGDGKVEIAVGGQWNPGDTNDSGSIHYLMPSEDRTQLWKPIELPCEPTVHRMRWVKIGESSFVLVVAPLHGRGNRNGDGKGCRLLAYTMPTEPTAEWRTTLIDDSLHMTHNFETGQWYQETPSEELLYIGREGAKLIEYSDGKWLSTTIDRIQGGGEIRMSHSGSGGKFIVTIEAMHGDRLIYYECDDPSKEAEAPINLLGRKILTDQLAAGHAVAVGDLFGDGNQQIVAGWRSPNKDGKVGLKLFWQDDANQWQQSWLDDNKMATEDACLADLNGDGRLDVIAAGRATHNLKIYWNLAR